MFNSLTELFLQNYFLFENIAGKMIVNTRLLFDKLFTVFLVSETDRAVLFDLTQCNKVRDIATYGNYAQFCRMQKYAELSEIESDVVSEMQDLISIKGNALRRAKQFGFEDNVATETAACKFLTESANGGAVTSLNLLGFLHCEGIFVEKNLHLGIKNLDRTAKWNNVEGILLSLYYSENDRKINLDRLYTVTRGTPFEDVYVKAVKRYDMSYKAHVLPEAQILKKAFGAGILKPELYMAQYARFIYSEILGLKDKERALFSGHKEAISETADLPLRLTCGEIAFDASAFQVLPLTRDEEQERIFRIVCNSDLRKDPAYRPLCLCCDSDYLLNLYLSAMGKAFSSAHVERIDVADLEDYNFEPTGNNLFVRSCNEKKQNVYFLCFKGYIKDPIMNAVKNFLQSDKRKKFRLQHPAAMIDLSAVLPVCFCDRQNARALRAYCDVVTLLPVSKAEKPNVIAYITHTKSERYKMKSIDVDVSVQKFLAEYSVDKAEYLIDKAVRFYRGTERLLLTAAILKEVSIGETGMSPKYGFGGADNESD